MKIHVLSDLHIEFGPFKYESTDADVVVLAGDIGAKKRGLQWILESVTDKPVLYILGNHEFYNGAYPKLIVELKRAAEGTNVTIMENDEVTLFGVRFLGCTLWTDFNLLGNPSLAESIASVQMNDYKRIRKSPEYSRFSPRDSAVVHHDSIQWLQQRLDEAWGGPTVIVTHHAPSVRSIPVRFKGDTLNAAFASDLEPLVTGSNSTLWIHGHLHRAVDYRINDTRIICNPRGYPGEFETWFNPSLVIEVDGCPSLSR